MYLDGTDTLVWHSFSLAAFAQKGRSSPEYNPNKAPTVTSPWHQVQQTYTLQAELAWITNTAIGGTRPEGHVGVKLKTCKLSLTTSETYTKKYY